MEHNETCWVYGVIFLDLKNCGCGYYDGRIEILKETLNALPLYERENVPEYLRTPLGEWFLTLLDRAKLIDHGTSIGSSWITPKGERVLAVLNDENEYQKLISDDWEIGFCECYDCLSRKKS